MTFLLWIDRFPNSNHSECKCHVVSEVRLYANEHLIGDVADIAQHGSEQYLSPSRHSLAGHFEVETRQTPESGGFSTPSKHGTLDDASTFAKMQSAPTNREKKAAVTTASEANPA
jgi:hypothetical protein